MSAAIFYSEGVAQVYGRMEGFEHYLESLFGPKRPFNSKELQDNIPKLRWARNAPSNGAIKSKIDGLGEFGNKFGEPKASGPTAHCL